MVLEDSGVPAHAAQRERGCGRQAPVSQVRLPSASSPPASISAAQRSYSARLVKADSTKVNNSGGGEGRPSLAAAACSALSCSMTEAGMACAASIGGTSVGAEKREAGDTEEGVEDVREVSRLVGDATVLLVLAGEDEAAQRLAVDPPVPPQQAHRRQHPPRVAHVRVLLRPAVESASGRLPLAEPPGKLLAPHAAQLAADGECTHAGEDLPRVRLAARLAAVPAVEVLARTHVPHRGGHVDVAELSEERRAAERAVREAGVHLAPLVSGEGAVRPLQRGDVPHHAPGVDSVQRAEEREHLHGGERVEHMRVVAEVAAEAAAAALAGADEGDDLRCVERLQLAEEVQSAGAPVDAREAEVLRDLELEGIGVGAHAEDVGAVQRASERRLGPGLGGN
eukprot:CAMPEP_0185348804 /NCGR_PEP_ID=MMETSP1364-20130426/1949_1 /TAXON_ID=38817 /ORGANISM="Gephyrocapsa oceanica, Strain RCC1303" /LENGTH=395 /DNA_ID=CAMNT_0027948265 /DNA_START=137 /DNA_END=1324 /DNA_ORIENTATION=+